MVNRVNKSRESRGATWQAFEAKRDAGLGHVLLKAARLWNERAFARMRAGDASELRAVHTQLFPHLGPEGLRLTDLAARLGVSKPAAGKLVAELEARGAVTVKPDPRDGRAKLVRLSVRGQRAFLRGIQVMSSLERELAAELGPRELRRLRDALRAVVRALTRPTAPGKSSDRARGS